MELCSKIFGRNGGFIGCGGECDWVIFDCKWYLFKQYVWVSYCNGVFYLIDISSNGICVGNGSCLLYGELQCIEQDSVFLFGDFEICVWLLCEFDEFVMDVGWLQLVGSIILDDVFLVFDLLQVFDQDGVDVYEFDDLSVIVQFSYEVGVCVDYVWIDMESLVVLELVFVLVVLQEFVESLFLECDEVFWQCFGQVLGMDFEGFDGVVCEVLVINVVGLLWQCIGGLQQSLWICSELKNELCLLLSMLCDIGKNFLCFSVDVSEVLGYLLWDGKFGQLSGEQVVVCSFCDFQVYQVVLFGVSWVVVCVIFEYFLLQQLVLCFECDGCWLLLVILGSCWCVYGCYYQLLCQDDDWSECLLVCDFVQVYEEQVCLIFIFYIEY